MNTSILFETIKTAGDSSIGVATLNSPRTLNALNHEMIKQLGAKLMEWEHDDRIACIYLKGAGEKAFCAGGDVREVYNRLTSGDQNQVELAKRFIEDEYKLDYQIFNYSKPIICCGDGIVMGGGLGLLAAASHSFVTDKSLLAMPEIKIGLYPDVGATYFLGRLPNNIGLYIGLTSCFMNANDALYCKLANFAIEQKYVNEILNRLKDLKLNKNIDDNSNLISKLLNSYHNDSAEQIPQSNLVKYKELIVSIVNEGKTLDEVKDAILSTETLGDKWLEQNKQTLNYGSPTSASIIYGQMKTAKTLSRAEVLDFELKLSLNCFENGEFVEGVRALLIDKDLKPHWN